MKQEAAADVLRALATLGWQAAEGSMTRALEEAAKRVAPSMNAQNAPTTATAAEVVLAPPAAADVAAASRRTLSSTPAIRDQPPSSHLSEALRIGEFDKAQQELQREWDSRIEALDVAHAAAMRRLEDRLDRTTRELCAEKEARATLEKRAADANIRAASAKEASATLSKRLAEANARAANAEWELRSEKEASAKEAEQALAALKGLELAERRLQVELGTEKSECAKLREELAALQKQNTGLQRQKETLSKRLAAESKRLAGSEASDLYSARAASSGELQASERAAVERAKAILFESLEKQRVEHELWVRQELHAAEASMNTTICIAADSVADLPVHTDNSREPPQSPLRTQPWDGQTDEDVAAALAQSTVSVATGQSAPHNRPSTSPADHERDQLRAEVLLRLHGDGLPQNGPSGSADSGELVDPAVVDYVIGLIGSLWPSDAQELAAEGGRPLVDSAHLVECLADTAEIVAAFFPSVSRLNSGSVRALFFEIHRLITAHTERQARAAAQIMASQASAGCMAHASEQHAPTINLAEEACTEEQYAMLLALEEMFPDLDGLASVLINCDWRLESAVHAVLSALESDGGWILFEGEADCFGVGTVQSLSAEAKQLIIERCCAERDRATYNPHISQVVPDFEKKLQVRVRYRESEIVTNKGERWIKVGGESKEQIQATSVQLAWIQRKRAGGSGHGPIGPARRTNPLNKAQRGPPSRKSTDKLPPKS
jgi:hypothetical protein